MNCRHLLILILTFSIYQITFSTSLSEKSEKEKELSGESSSGGSDDKHLRESQFYYAPYVTRAVDSGVNEAKELFDQIEPRLYSQDFVLRGDHPSVYLAAINHQSPRAKELSRHAYASLRATLSLKEQLASLRDDDGTDREVTKISLWDTPLQSSNCPNKRRVNECEEGSTLIYRRNNGMCNNLKNPTWGSSFQPFARYLPPEYDDGVSSIRKSVTGKNLPSPRKISTHIHKDPASRSSATNTLLLMQWGEFLDHDLTLTAQVRGFNSSVPKCCQSLAERHPDCLPIHIPFDDPFYKGMKNCMEFVRSSPAPRLSCDLGPREQLNQLTTWLDGSVIYGSTEEDVRQLRLFRHGKLKYHHVSNRKELLPRLRHAHDGECKVSSPRLFCFSAGDVRANEHPGLTAMHTIWLRQHNLIADKLAILNKEWSEEILFQETKKIVTAQLQHITFHEFLPLVLGPNAVKTFGLKILRNGFYHGYNNSIDGTIPTVFASAAFRFGHSLVPSNLPRWDETHRKIPNNVNLSMELMTPSNLHNLGEVDRIFLGLASQRSHRRDEFITAELTNHLFKTQGHDGLDLAAINIQRGRDHGLPPYVKWREACGLLKPLKHNGPLITWLDFAEATGLESGKIEKLIGVYESPWDVDLFPGGMLELPVRGGIVGPTFACIIGQTFRNIRKGDRFWYENPGQFMSSQLQSIRNMSLARIICDTTDSITSIQPIVFLASELQKNPQANCSNSNGILPLNLRPWHRVNPAEALFNNAKQFDTSIIPVIERMKPKHSLLANYLSDSSLHESEEDDFDSSHSPFYKPIFSKHSH